MDRKQRGHRISAGVLLLFIALSLALTYPLPRHLADAVEDRQDALLNVWITAWDGHALLADPLHLFDANIFHPYPRTLAYSELLLGNALLALPVTAISGNPVPGYNLALLLSFVLSGWGTYLLVLKLSRSSGAGLVAGLLFAFSSYRLTNLAQAQLLTTQWLPFALLALHQLLRRPRLQAVATFVLFFGLQTLSSFYYGLLLALALFGYWLFDLGDWLRSRNKHYAINNTRYAPRSRHLLLAAFCLLLLLLPFALPYFQVQRELGFERSLADSEPFSASLRQYLLVPPGSVLHGRWLPSDDTPLAGGYPADALFPGVVASALAVWGLIRGQGRARWFFFLLLLASFVLSLGPRLYLAPGQPAALDVALPYAWLYAVVPGFKALRAPARFDVLVTLALAVLAGYGVASFKRQATSGKRAPLLLVACCLLLVVESWVWPAAQVEPAPVGDAVPPVYRWLADAGKDTRATPILELPMAFTPGGPQLDYQYFSTYHWQTTPDGYSGFIPPKHGQIVYEMERFPSERSVSLLQALGVGYVVVHSDRYPAARWAEMQAVLAQAADLELVQTFASDQVYQVRPRAFEPEPLDVTVYFPPRAVAGEPYTAYVLVVNRGEQGHAVQPTDLLRPEVLWGVAEGDPMVEVEADVPLVLSPGGAAVIPLPLTAPRITGMYSLFAREEGGPLGSWSAAALVEVGDQGDDAFPVPARLEAWDLPATARPGDSLPVRLTWRALGKIDAYYSIYVKLLDGEGNAVAGWDGQPQAGAAPTLLWAPGEPVDDLVTLTLPADVPPGEYRIEVGMYRAPDPSSPSGQGLARCLTLDADGQPISQIVLGTVQVEP